MLNSFVALSYPDDRFEIIIVDDSTDDTYQKIPTRLPDLQDLKVIHRQSRAGWKG
jgi:glycosyltransferase involved in cell wall biosynthesis